MKELNKFLRLVGCLGILRGYLSLLINSLAAIAEAHGKSMVSCRTELDGAFQIIGLIALIASGILSVVIMISERKKQKQY